MGIYNAPKTHHKDRIHPFIAPICRNLFLPDQTYTLHSERRESTFEMPATEPNKNIEACLDNLSVREEDYHVSDDEFVVPGEEEDESDLESPAIHTVFDLIAFENANAGNPIYTRTMIRCMAADVSEVMSKQKRSIRERKCDSVSRLHSYGHRVNLWKANGYTTNSVTIQYSTRIELCADFQRRFSNVWQRSKDLRKLNDHMPERLLSDLRVPYHFTTWLRSYRVNHLDDAWMKEMRTKLCRTQESWDASHSCTQLLDLVRTNAWNLETPITKIVCFGLGRLDPNPVWYGSTLQHLAVFSIADTLDAVNQERFPTTPLVKVIAQDPNYETADHILLSELTSTPVAFDNTEPKALLAIDENTLIVTAFLPTTVPLIQIVADMFADGLEKGPGMIICDEMKGLSVEKRMYNLRFNRDAPHVARFLLNGYKKQEEFVDWDEKLREDAVGNSNVLKYWLPRMDFWVRNDETI